MKFTINIERKHFYFLAAIISVLGIFTVFAATPFNPSSPLHPLQQISLDENGIASVDADSNSIIDNSDKLQGLSASEFCKSNGLDCSEDIQVNSVTLGGVTRTTWPGTLIWSLGVSNGTFCCLICPGPKSGECSPEGSTHDYADGVSSTSGCGSPTEPEPKYFKSTQTCVDAG